ncbi:uncharacterized protein LOC101156589 [Oryzias latipes]|uniref:uncharacterized protein LOC101156589 n=1 Tax=Oryzias latipes TaxID=8090 RepID=UPI0000E9C264|nr:uncharacterized protein LOC101156589 [Oryzias latipes]
MAKLMFAVVVAVASLIVAESLVCNKCTFGLLGFCLGAANETCPDANSTCFNSVSTFPAITSFKGFSFQGCASNNSGCGAVFTSTFLGTTYSTNYTCCSTDRCNTVVSAAPSSKIALSAAIGASILAFMLSM